MAARTPSTQQEREDRAGDAERKEQLARVGERRRMHLADAGFHRTGDREQGQGAEHELRSLARFGGHCVHARAATGQPKPAGDHKTGASCDAYDGQLRNAVRKYPRPEEQVLTFCVVLHRERSQRHAVEEQQRQRSEPEREPEGEDQQRNIHVVREQPTRERCRVVI
jgi:hypothetical protein